MKNHKKDCTCCVCKGKRNKREDLNKDILHQKYIIEHKSMETCSNELKEKIRNRDNRKYWKEYFTKKFVMV